MTQQMLEQAITVWGGGSLLYVGFIICTCLLFVLHILWGAV